MLRLRFWLASRLPLGPAAAVWVAGLALVRSDLLAPLPALALILALMFLLLLLRRRGLLLLFFAALLLGLCFLLLLARQYDLPAAWLEHPVTLEASIAAIDERPAYRRLLLEDIESATGSGKHRHFAGRLRVYLHATSVPQLLPGDRVRLRLQLRRPRNDRNPGAFDYRRWCFDHGIAAIGSVQGRVQLLSRHPRLLHGLRQHIRRVIRERPAFGLPGTAALAQDGKARADAILKALLLADRSEIAAVDYDIFSASGTAHLLAISGMHVGMVAALFYALAWWLLTRFEVCMVYLPVRSLALLAGLLGACGYALLAGWPWPAMRAGLMLAAGVLAWLLRARASPLNTLLAALMLLLACDASAVVSLSLWMSFLATAAVLIWVEGGSMDEAAAAQGRMRRAIAAVFWVSLVAGLATLPLVVDVFGRLPVYGLAANMVMVPLYGLWVLPAALAGEISAFLSLDAAAGWLMSFAAAGIDAGLAWIGMLGSWPLGRLWLPRPGMVADLALVSGMLLAAVLWLARGRGSGALMLLVAGLGIYLLMAVPERDVDAPTWWVWDVGQGASSALLLPDGFVLLADAPGRAGQRFDGGTKVAAGLRHLGHTHADVLLISHAQADHIGGAVSLIRGLNRVGEIWLAAAGASRHRNAGLKRLLAEAMARGIPVRWLKAGDRIRLDRHGLAVRVLWPPVGSRRLSANNNSLVLELELANGVRLLLPGDIERDAEARLAGLRPVHAMLMPHHGSRSSSSPELLHQLRPRIAVAQSGRDNRFGFPHADIVRRYRALGAAVRNTADGAVRILLNGPEQLWLMPPWPAPASSRQHLALQWWRRLL